MVETKLNPLHEQIYNYIKPCRGSLSESSACAIARNIAFLVRYTFGPSIDPNRVSVTVIDIHENDNSEKGHKATVMVHYEKGTFKTIVDTCVQRDTNVILSLKQKVDAIIEAILNGDGRVKTTN